MREELCYEKIENVGKYRISEIVIFTSNESDTKVKLLLAADNYGLYCKVQEFEIENKLSEAVRCMIVEQLIQTYSLLLLPGLIKQRERIEKSSIDELEVKEVIEIKSMEEYIKDIVFSILKRNIPNIKIKDT